MELAVVLLVLGVVVLVAGTALGLFWSRHSTLSGRVGSFTCGLRTDEGPPSRGIAQYTTGRLEWWRVLSLAPRPARSWSRDELTLVEQTPVDELDEGGQPLLHVRCVHGEETFDLLMSAPACAGLVSWLESGPRPLGRVM